MNEATFKRRLWEEHLAMVAANGATARVEAKGAKMTPSERTKRWRLEHAEHVAEYNAAYTARRKAQMTPEDVEAERRRRNTYERTRYASDPEFRKRKNAASSKRAKERRAWLKENDPEGYAELRRRDREAQARLKAKKEASCE